MNTTVLILCLTSIFVIEESRRPRCVMISASWCSPCQKMKRENPDWIKSSESAPVQVVKYTDEETLKKLGLPKPSGVPVFYIIGKNGKWKKTPPKRGYMTRAKLKEYLVHHKVKLK